MGLEKKRRWDSTELKTNVDSVDSVVEDNDTQGKSIASDAAIKAALEVAKKLSAKLEAAKAIEPCEDTAKSIDLNTNSNEISSSDSTNSFKLTFSFEKDSPNSVLFLDPSSLQTLLISKLQLGPSERFALIVSESELHFEASSKDILDLAEKECISIRETGRLSGSKPKSSKEKISLGYDASLPPAHTSFLRGKLLGPQGSFLKHIHSVTNCRVQLRGKGSGHIDVVKENEVEPLHLVIEGGVKSGEEEWKEARQLCEDLIETAKTEYEAKFLKPTTPQPQYPHYPQYSQAQYPLYPYMAGSSPQTQTQPAQSIEQAQAQAQAQYYQQYQQALAQYYAQFAQNKQL